jgi:hypothetical protein
MRKTVLLLGTLTTYLRLDGQDIAGNPALRQQLDLDSKASENEGGDRDCMAVKGYVSVPKDQRPWPSNNNSLQSPRKMPNSETPLCCPRQRRIKPL